MLCLNPFDLFFKVFNCFLFGLDYFILMDARCFRRFFLDFPGFSNFTSLCLMNTINHFHRWTFQHFWCAVLLFLSIDEWRCFYRRRDNVLLGSTFFLFGRLGESRGTTLSSLNYHGWLGNVRLGGGLQLRNLSFLHGLFQGHYFTSLIGDWFCHVSHQTGLNLLNLRSLMHKPLRRWTGFGIFWLCFLTRKSGFNLLNLRNFVNRPLSRGTTRHGIFSFFLFILASSCIIKHVGILLS